MFRKVNTYLRSIPAMCEFERKKSRSGYAPGFFCLWKREQIAAILQERSTGIYAVGDSSWCFLPKHLQGQKQIQPDLRIIQIQVY